MPKDKLCYDLKAIFELLNTVFDDTTLETFCLINFPVVHERFGRGMRKDEKINLLVEYCNRVSEQRFDKLLEAVREEDQELYKAYEPYRKPCDDDRIISTAGELTTGTVTEANQSARQPKSVDFVIVTALEEERDALLVRLPEHRRVIPSHDDVRVYYESNLPTTFPDGSTGTYRIVVMPLLGMGRVQATAATGDAIRQWKPRYVMLVGIAGGIEARKVNIGDILISDQIVDYELQKITTKGPEMRWEVYRADPRLIGAVRNFRSDQWLELITAQRPRGGMPKRHIGPIASGDKVIAFDEVLAKYQDVWPKLIGVEMEAGGVAAASFQAIPQPGFFMVRAVSDLADNKKNSPSTKKWRPYACEAAASYTIALLRSGPVPQALEEANREERRQQDKPASLEVQIVVRLYTYAKEHPGDPEMELNSLIDNTNAEKGQVLDCMFKLRERRWLEYELMPRGEQGLVWLTQRGRRVARDLV